MATAAGKSDKKSAKATGKMVEAEDAKTTEADGYVDETKTQTTAKGTAAEPASPATKSAAAGIDKRRGLDNKTLIGLYRTMYMSGKPVTLAVRARSSAKLKV